MSRPLDAATATAFQQSDLPLATIVKLDILGDPLLTWTGLGDLVFTAGQTGDAQLDGNIFTGSGNIFNIGVVTDAYGGSDTMTISVTGVDITMPLLRQLIYNRDRWQFRKAWVWMVVFDPVTSTVTGKPFRIKTGRMDQMPYSESGGMGTVSVNIEGQQSYGQQPLLTRYSEAPDLNSADVSQNFVYSLSNMTASMGTPSAAPAFNANTWGGGGGGRINGFNTTRIL